MARLYRPDKHLAYNNESSKGMDIDKNKDWVALKRRIIYLGAPVHEWDATTKFYVDEKFQNCLNLDPPKNKFDVGGNPLTGLAAPTTDTDAVTLKYFQDNTISNDDLNKTLDDFATIKYVDDEITKAAASKEQSDESQDEPKFDLSDYYTSDDVDTLLTSLKDNLQSEDDNLELNITELKKDVTELQDVKYFIGECKHNNEKEVEFPKPSDSPKPQINGQFEVSSDHKTLTIKEAGIWEITFLDQINERDLRRAEMIVTNADIKTDKNSFFKRIYKTKTWETFYFSRILPLKANATLQIRFEGKLSTAGFDGELYSKIIIKKYLNL